MGLSVDRPLDDLPLENVELAPSKSHRRCIDHHEYHFPGHWKATGHRSICRGGVPKKGNKKINKEIKYLFLIFLGYVFPQKLGLDSIVMSWDLKIRIPRRKLRI